MCAHVHLTVVIGNIDKVDKLVHKGYKLWVYKKLYGDPEFKIRLPIWSDLRVESLLPPLPVEGQVGVPRKGLPKEAAIRVIGDYSQDPVPDCSVKTRPVLRLMSSGVHLTATTKPIAREDVVSDGIPEPTSSGVPARKLSTEKQRGERKKARKRVAPTGDPSPSAAAKPILRKGECSRTSRVCVDLSQESRLQSKS